MKLIPAALLLPFALLTGRAQPAGNGRSPFMPPTGAAPSAGASQGETYELAGASASQEGTQICLYNTSTKHSRWLNVGESDGDLQVMSYDGNNDQAVVRFDGRVHVLSLRQARTKASGPAGFSPVPPAGTSLAANAPMVDPSTVGKSQETIKQEREARMLVSDLLEISIKQRKAYEEAQKRAAKQGGAAAH